MLVIDQLRLNLCHLLACLTGATTLIQLVGHVQDGTERRLQILVVGVVLVCVLEVGLEQQRVSRNTLRGDRGKRRGLHERTAHWVVFLQLMYETHPTAVESTHTHPHTHTHTHTHTHSYTTIHAHADIHYLLITNIYHLHMHKNTNANTDTQHITYLNRHDC
jgi:hypothetical protein